jgi:sarcosine oxidase, subunit beta
MIADVCIVGAGVLGASTAWHLVRLGVKRVVLVDPAPASGSTSRATGGFRATFAGATNVRLSLLSRSKLLRFQEETGIDPGFRAVGYLWLARSSAELARLDAALAVQRAAGLEDSRLVSGAEIASLNPAVDDGHVVGGLFGAGDGTLRPLAILSGYLEDARRHGAEVVVERATGLIGSDRILGVQTENQAVAADSVVLAAGAWIAPLARTAGIDVPVTPLRRQIAETEVCPLPEHMPMTLWLEDGFHLRVRDGRALLLRSTPGAADPFDTTVEPGWVSDVARTAAQRIRGLADVPVARSWAGLYEMSPDGHALLGPVPGRSGLFVVGGASGHGVMHAPALGQLVAESIVLGQARSLDARPLALERFAEGRAHAPDPL